MRRDKRRNAGGVANPRPPSVPRTLTLYIIMLGLSLRAAACSQEQPTTSLSSRLVYQTVGRAGDGELRLRDLPKGRELVLWQWSVEPYQKTLSHSHCTLSPGGRYVLLVQEWYVPNEYFPEYVFALTDLAKPLDGTKLLSFGGSFYLIHHPVWVDNSRFVVGVADELHQGGKGYRELVCDPVAGVVERLPRPKHDLEGRMRREVEMTTQALARVPQSLVPEDVRALGGLIPAEDGAGMTVKAIELLIKSYVSLSPSRTRIAIADQGKRVTIVSLDSGAQRRVEPLHLVVGEATRIEGIRWSRDERQVLFTERHYQGREWVPGVIKPPGWREVVSLIRSVDVDSGQTLTLVSGRDGLWVQSE